MKFSSAQTFLSNTKRLKMSLAVAVSVLFFCEILTSVARATTVEGTLCGSYVHTDCSVVWTDSCKTMLMTTIQD